MPLPFDEFPASAATFDLTTGEISYETAGALAESGTVAGSIIEGAGIAAAAAALAEPALIAGVGLAGLAAVDAVAKRYAPTRTVPNFTQLFSGGQNNGTTYNVVIRYKFVGGSETEVNQNFPGAIGGIRVSTSGGDQRRYDLITGGNPFLVATGADGDFEEKPFIVSVARVSGAPDTAQNPAIQPVPFGTLTIPSPTETTVNQPNGDPVRITFVPYPSPSVTSIQQPGQRDQPGILVAVPEAGMLINFSPTGVTIRYREPFASTQVAPRLSPSVPTVPRPPAECDCPEFDGAEIIRRLKDLENCDRCSDYTYTDYPKASGNSATVTSLEDEPVSVRLTLTSSPSNIRTQSGGDNSPEVVYAGWFAPIIRGVPSVRVPINYANQSFILDKAATGFIYYGVTGCSFTSVYTGRKRNNPPDPG